MNSNNIYLRFLKVSKTTGVPVKKILDLFWYLLQEEAVENNKLLQKIGVSKNALNQVKKALCLYLKPSSQFTALKSEAFEKMKKFYPKNYQPEEDFFSFLIQNDVCLKSKELLLKVKNKRPSPKRIYDQFTATLETIAKRVALIDFFGDIKGKRILFLGDADFTSLPVANLKSAEEVVVVEIDRGVIKAIKEVSEEFNLEIKTIECDLRKGIPTTLKGKFDTVFTDPPYTPEGIMLFISRAIESTDRTNQTARIYICYGNSDRAKERFLPIQEILVDSGLMIRWVLGKFNRYERAESIGSSSSLYVTEVTPKTKSLIKGNFNKPIYTAKSNIAHL